ncbi:hypothetical protein D3C72_2135320 [compost metagenome]
MAGHDGVFVGGGDERQAGKGGQFRGDRFAEAVGRVQPGTDRRAALGQFTDRRQRTADRPFGVVELGDERRDFLAKGDRRGVHHVGAAGLDQVLMARRQFCEPRRQLGDCR